ncbi:MAG: hypothetical protein CSB23_03490 [Deltaproteobacteria bacterium]|nr:MAG: hypothetical protein CSB23_03490 [Deltaproteobacteria bacterium]
MVVKESYREEQREIYHHRVSLVLFCGVLLMLFFSVFDRPLQAQSISCFSTCRLGAAFVCALLFVVNSFDQRHRYSKIIGLIGFFVMNAGLVLPFLVSSTGSKVYFVSLVTLMVLYVVCIPIHLGEALAAIGLPFLSFILVHFLKRPDGFQCPNYYPNLFAFTCFTGIAICNCWFDIRFRKRDLALREEEETISSELTIQAAKLESEVGRHYNKQLSIEKRYRQLFNSIADDVIVVARNGSIVQANKAFRNHFDLPNPQEPGAFWQLLVSGTRQKLVPLFLDALESDITLHDIRVLLMAANGFTMEADVNVTVIGDRPAEKRLLLTIRDILPREKIKAEIIEALKIRKKTENAAIMALTRLSEFKVAASQNHLRRLREYCKILAEDIAGSPSVNSLITATFIEDIYNASILHDIGKVALPDQYILEAEASGATEDDLLKQHTIIGGDVIKDMERESPDSGFLTMAKHIAYFHHELWDGSGYPHGLSGEEIPLAARIVSVANAYEELVTGFYTLKGLCSHSEAIAYINSLSGVHFDPVVVSGLLRRQDAFVRVYEKYTVASDGQTFAERVVNI